jgi:hypothetical protein
MVTFALIIQISIWNRWNQGHSNNSRVVRRHAITWEWKYSSRLNLRTRLLTFRSHCSHEKSLQYPFIRTLDGPQKTSESFGEEVNFLLLPGIESLFLGCIDHSLVAILTALSRCPDPVIEVSNIIFEAPLIFDCIWYYIWKYVYCVGVHLPVLLLCVCICVCVCV